MIHIIGVKQSQSHLIPFGLYMHDVISHFQTYNIPTVKGSDERYDPKHST